MTTSAIKRIIPVSDEDTQPYWDYCRQHELRMQRCLQCGQLRYPVGPLCPHCGSAEAPEWVKLSGRGRVWTFAVVRQPYHPDYPVPYVLAVIQLEEGPRLFSTIVGCPPNEVKMEMAVEVAWEDLSDSISLPVFRPVR